MTTAIPRSLAITDRRLLHPAGSKDPADRAFLTALDAWLDRLQACHLDALQVREKDLDDAPLFRLVRHIVEHFAASGQAGPRVLVNGRVDIALAAGAHGVHLPASGLPTSCLRPETADGAAVAPHPAIGSLLLGRSTHRLLEVQQAAREDVDYVTFGPLFATPSKASWTTPPGPDGVSQVSTWGIPVLALGGIVGPAQVAAAKAAGGHGVAAIRGFVESPEALCEAVREHWPTASTPGGDL